MAFLRVPPLHGEDETPQRLYLCDQPFSVLGYGGDQRPNDLAPYGPLLEGDGER